MSTRTYSEFVDFAETMAALPTWARFLLACWLRLRGVLA